MAYQKLSLSVIFSVDRCAENVIDIQDKSYFIFDYFLFNFFQCGNVSNFFFAKKFGYTGQQIFVCQVKITFLNKFMHAEPKSIHKNFSSTSIF
jgi:hypothetical protein